MLGHVWSEPAQQSGSVTQLSIYNLIYNSPRNCVYCMVLNYRYFIQMIICI